MTTEDLKYITDNANSGITGSIQRVSCADVRKLLAERADLLAALQLVLSHEGETEVNGIGCESDSDALQAAKKAARLAIHKATA